MKTNKLVSILLIILVVGLVIGGLLYLSISLIKGTNEKTIDVQGTYTVKKDPDKVWLSLGVETQDQTAQAAENTNKEISNNLYKSLEKLGLTSKDYKTESYYVNPITDWQEGNKIKGYTATHMIRVDTDKINLASPILDAAVDAGANLIYGVYFDLSDNARETAKAETLKKATEVARQKADAIAEGLGAKITGIKSVSDSSVNYYPMVYREMAIADVSSKGAESIITQPGNVEVTSTVSVTYKIA